MNTMVFRHRGERVVPGKKANRRVKFAPIVEMQTANSRRAGRKPDEKYCVFGRGDGCGVSLGVGRLGAIGRHQQGGRRLFLRGSGQGGADHEEGRQAAHLRDHHPHRGQRVLRSGLRRRAGRRQRLRHQSDPIGLRSADRRHPARNPDPQPDRQRPHDQRRDHDDAAGRRLQRHRQEAGGTRRRGRDHQFLRRHAATTAATSAIPARTRRRRRSAARRSSNAC